MKIETLNKNFRKKWLIGLGITVVIVATIMFVGSRAKYKNTQSIDLVDGTINWKPYDLNTVAIKLQNDSGNYTDTNTVPTSGYLLSSDSYCEISGVRDSSIAMNYHDGVVDFYNMSKKKTKCYLFFIKPIAKSTILAGKTIDTSRSSGSFTGSLTTNTTGKIYKAADDDGDTYFFAGAVDNNWVKFGNFYWRIIRINGDGTVRMIYSGAANGNASDANKTGTTTQISNYGTSFNEYSGQNPFVGYMYGDVDQSGENGYANTHKNTNSSTIKKAIDTWYNTNLNKVGIKEHIDTNAGFCGDRQISTITRDYYHNTGYGFESTVYAAADRILDENFNDLVTETPTFKCAQKNDWYTLKGASKGNKALTYPIGLITIDEIIYGGAFIGRENTNLYLNTNQTYWTMSPLEGGSTCRLFLMGNNGSFGYPNVDAKHGVRPVINLRADTKLTGTGTTSDPYIVS